MSDSAEIIPYYDQNYRQEVIENKSPDSWIEIAIKVDETYIYGDEGSGVTGFACGAVLNFLDSVEAVLNDEQYIVEFEFGPSWLALDPRDDASIYVGRCSTLKGARNPDERLEIDVQRPVSKQGWIDAVIDTAREFYDTIVELNPSLLDDDSMIQIQTKIMEVEEHTLSNDGGYRD
ncbi:hypothetical protein G6M89_20195 [Natronolimnobius sp. AArcel1]|uniref:hypothetical protein n=1 Tax=Natronolimnobius sp. AArcel1 TaxID=1679093 RepID=UPI0013EE3974|nr:hypothetical protein [Natronolimnobius sp. AArcel1]NGM71291.1 hypothetical protein [Natronolimnobius sp. AArcel1]